MHKRGWSNIGVVGAAPLALALALAACGDAAEDAAPAAEIAEDGKPAPAIRFPLTIKGNLEWGKNRLPLDASFAP